MNENIPSAEPFHKPQKPLLKRFFTLFKMAAIAILILLLLIPLSMIQSVLRDRLERRDGAVREIASTWGSEQIVMGPVLIIPYEYDQKTWQDKIVNGRIEHVESKEPTRGYAHFLPASFKADGRLNPERLHRGIYETIVYRGALNLSGSFARPSFEEWGIDPRRVLWNEAEIAVSITDLRGTNESLQMMLGGQMYPLKPGKKLEGLNGVYGRVKGLSGDFETLPFAMSLTLNGSRSLRFAPVGINNDVRLSSSWPDPSFQGAFLPSDRKVGADGFIARWQVSYYGREYPQQWNNANSISAAVITSSLLGVDMASTLDSYRYVERSCKYGVLLIALLFSAFFIFENLSTVRIHPFQYTLVGFALCLFYLGLLALSEVTSFAIAYWIGAAAASLMIALYCVKALQSIKRGCVLAAGLAVIYGFLFVILRMQDFSLLVGTAGLFLALAIVMFVTRNIDWYARDNS